MTFVGGVAREVADASILASRKSRRAAFLARAQAVAWKASGSVELDLAPDIRIGRNVRVVVDQGTHTVIRFGPKCVLEDNVLIACKGGQLLAGDHVELRRDVIVNVTGRLTIEGDTPVSWGSVLHCSEDIHLERMVGIAEQVTIADSSHYFTEPDVHFWHNVRTGPIRIGTNTWICPKAIVARNSDIGSHCIVASGSVVSGKVPDGHLASGVPAVVRPLSLPWRDPS